LADMVQDELLSKDVLRRKLSAWDFSGVLIRILSKQEVKLAVGSLLTNLVEDIDGHMEPREFTRILQGLLGENMGGINLSQTLAEVVQFSLDHGDVDQVLKVICQTIDDYVEQPEVKGALRNMMEAALTRYGDNNPARKMVVKFLPAPSVLAHGLQEKVKTALQDGTVERWLKDSLRRYVLELKTKPSLQESLNQVIISILDKNSDSEVKKKDATWIRTSTEKRPSIAEHFIGDLGNNWDEYLGKLKCDRPFRLKVDERVKLILEKQIGLHHKAIGRMVHEGLDPLTDDKLVELIEDKAGNDLQMIRINGSVVGGLAGMLIYLLGMVLK